MNNICIYKHTSPSGKVYIGLTGLRPEYRWDNGKGYKGCTLFFNAINKYGWDNIEHLILFSNLDLLNADIIEEDLIYYYKLIGKSYNLATGGKVNRGWKYSEESKKKLSKAMKGKGTKKVMLIDPKSGEVVKIWDSEIEACEFYKGNPGLIYDAIRRHSLTKGYYWLYEGEEILPINNRNLHCKYVLLIDKKTLEVIKVWDSLSEVERQLNIPAGNISNVCKGKRKTAGGFIWRMKD